MDLKGIVESIVFQNLQNGFTVAKVSTSNSMDKITIVVLCQNSTKASKSERREILS